MAQAIPIHAISGTASERLSDYSASRQQKGSRNWRKAVQRCGKLYCAVANQRANTLHHPTNRLPKTGSTVVTIVIEDLNVASILKSHHRA
jgi:transposase